MKIKAFATCALAIAALTSCSDKKQDSSDYTLNVTVEDPSANGTLAYLTEFDTGEVMDSVIITDGKAVFTGSIEEPTIVRLSVNGNRGDIIILESGETQYKDGRAISSLNDQYEAFIKNLTARRDSLYSLIDTTMTDAQQEAFARLAAAHIDSVVSETMVANIYNPIGYMLFLQKAYDMEADKFQQFLKDYPHLTKFQRIDKIKKSYEAREATSAGKPYTDFEIDYNGATSKLSDYVKPGQYTLIDFWASWCGPCKKEIKLIKQLYDQYNQKGLNVVGVAVWEDPAQTEAYLAENPLPWDVMLNAQSVPTDIYGINGIPCIILVDPEGNIVERDLFEEDLVNTVATAMGDAPETI